MSYWTHIVATIDIDTFIQDKNIKEIIEEKLKDAPKITGSEGNADIFVNIPNGYNVWIGRDCNSCQYKDTIIHHDEGGSSCDPEEDYQCPDGKYQTKAVITIIGDLRDRMKKETKEEYKDFVKYLKNECEFMIDNKTVNIKGY